MEELEIEIDSDDISHIPAEVIAAGDEGIAQARAELGLAPSAISPTPFVIDSEARAEWLLAKLADIDAEAGRIAANTTKRVAELAADRESLLYRFGEQLTVFCRAEADRRRRKTVTLANGVVSFRTVPERLAVADLDAATATARTVCPAALVTETLTRLDRVAFLDAARAAMETTGELLPGVELIPATESVSIKPGAITSSKGMTEI